MKTKATFNDPNHVIAARICNLRNQWGLTQEKMAEELGIAYSYYCMLERGKRNLSLSVAEKLCRYHGVTYDYLYLGKMRPELELLRETASQISLTDRDALLNLIFSSTDEECKHYLTMIRAALALRS